MTGLSYRSLSILKLDGSAPVRRPVVQDPVPGLAVARVAVVAAVVAHGEAARRAVGKTSNDWNFGQKKFQ
jgi:hypothetical protein